MKVSDDMCDQILDDVWSSYRADRAGFAPTVHTHWAPVLDETDKLFSFVTGIVRTTIHARLPVWQNPAWLAAHTGPSLLDMDAAMLRLLGKSIRVSGSVLMLLREGMALDASGLSRTLYELGVVTEFVRQSGPDCAERYLAHEGIHHAKQLNREVKWFDRKEPEPSSDVAALKAKYPEGDFASPYGWACKFVKNKKGDVIKSPTFESLANRITGGRGYHPLYTRAGHQLHAGVYGTMLKAPVGDKGVLPLGPTLYWIGGVAHQVALHLHGVGARALQPDPSIVSPTDRWCRLLMERTVNRIETAVLECAERVEKLTVEQASLPQVHLESTPYWLWRERVAAALANDPSSP